MQKRLLVITYFDIFAVGGIETHVRRLLKNLSERGWSGIVITNAQNRNYEKNFRIGHFTVQYAFPEERTTMSWPVQKSHGALLFSLIHFWTRNVLRWLLILNAIFSLRIKVIYVPGPTHSSSTLLPVFFPFWGLLRILHIRTVLGVRGPFFAFCSGSTVADRAFRRVFFLDDVTQQVLADKIVYVDPYLNALYPSFKDKGVLITNSVDTDEFYPKPMEEIHGLVTYVGRLSPERGIWVFLKAVERVDGDHYLFQIVGPGALEKQIRDYVAENKINVLIRSASPEEMPSVYNESATIVNPALTEGPWIGNITLEAMACGKCVIKSSSCSSEDPVIKDGFNGLLFKSGDPEDLANKLTLALRSERLRVRLGENARETVLNKFGRDIEANKYDELFSPLLL